VGLAITEAPIEELNVEAGFHEYVLAPLTVNVAELPTQIVAELMLSVREGRTVTEAVVVFTQPAVLVPVIEYVVVIAGFAVTVAPVVALNPVPGDQL
jgi:hypothetical protein